jgi:predicted O-methyltransferase YrrM
MARLGRGVMKALGRIYGDRLVPVAAVALARRLSSGVDPLLPPEAHFQTDGAAIRHPQLRQLLTDQKLGSWSLGARTINWLEREIHRRRPKFVLEFGSGISTVCVARFLTDVYGENTGLRILSIDQDDRYAANTRALLEIAGLSDSVRLVACPLTIQTIEGLTANCYTIPSGDELGDFAARADMVLIDGPAAENGARFGTLPLAKPYLAPNAEFVLDDALRDGELDTLRRWARLPYVRLHGMRLIDKGLLVGDINW